MKQKDAQRANPTPTENARQQVGPTGSGNAAVQEDLRATGALPDSASSEGGGVDDWQTDADGVWLVEDPSDYQGTLIRKLVIGTSLQVLERGEGERFNACDSLAQWWNVAVIGEDGLEEQGWVMQALVVPRQDPVLEAPLGDDPEEPWTTRVPVDVQGRHKGEAEIGLNEDYGGQPLPDAFGMSYEGPDAHRFHWLQFCWGEILGRKEGSPWVGLPGVRFRTSAGEYDSTPDGTEGAPASPTQRDQVQHDGGHPWKDDNFPQDENAVAAVDAPTFKQSAVQEALEDNDIDEALLRQHYEIFLVKDERKVVSWTTVTMAWDPVREPVPNNPAVALSAQARAATRDVPEPFGSRLDQLFPKNRL